MQICRMASRRLLSVNNGSRGDLFLPDDHSLPVPIILFKMRKTAPVTPIFLDSENLNACSSCT